MGYLVWFDFKKLGLNVLVYVFVMFIDYCEVMLIGFLRMVEVEICIVECLFIMGVCDFLLMVVV